MVVQYHRKLGPRVMYVLAARAISGASAECLQPGRFSFFFFGLVLPTEPHTTTEANFKPRPDLMRQQHPRPLSFSKPRRQVQPNSGSVTDISAGTKEPEIVVLEVCMAPKVLDPERLSCGILEPHRPDVGHVDSHIRFHEAKVPGPQGQRTRDELINHIHLEPD